MSSLHLQKSFHVQFALSLMFGVCLKEIWRINFSLKPVNFVRARTHTTDTDFCSGGRNMKR